MLLYMILYDGNCASMNLAELSLGILVSCMHMSSVGLSIVVVTCSR